jgi:hypothetical protein
MTLNLTIADEVATRGDAIIWDASAEMTGLS